jgi:hypothetical protein
MNVFLKQRVKDGPINVTYKLMIEHDVYDDKKREASSVITLNPFVASQALEYGMILNNNICTARGVSLPVSAHARTLNSPPP